MLTFVFLMLTFTHLGQFQNVSNINPIPIIPAPIKNLIMYERLFELYTFDTKSNLSETCRKQTEILRHDFRKFHLWAYQMIDASSKFQSGLASGNIAELGDFDQCIAISRPERDIKGKYCPVTFSLTKLSTNLFVDNALTAKESRALQTLQILARNHLGNNVDLKIKSMGINTRWSFCVPDGCTADDIMNHLNEFFLPNLNQSFVYLDESKCQTMDTQMKLNAGDWTVISIFIIIIGIMGASSIYDVYLYYSKTESKHSLLTAFSIYTNYNRLTRFNNNPDVLPCLDGIRVLSILWIIQGHTYALVSMSIPMINEIDILNWFHQFWSLTTLCSPVSVDSFFLLSGTLLMYGFMKAKAKNIPFNVPVVYLHRYLRLTPALLAVIIFYNTIYSKMGSGPNWTIPIDTPSCQKYWWSSLLYLQNYINIDKMCVAQSWYLQVDMQLFLLSPLLLIPLGKWPHLSKPLITLIFATCSILALSNVWWNHMTGPFDPNYQQLFYVQTYTRAGPYVLGIGLGMLLYETKNKEIHINKFLVGGLWVFSLGIMSYTLFAIYPADEVHKFSTTYLRIYAALNHNIWSVGLAWIIFACVKGYGGPVNWFLSLPIFQFFARITYCMYLTHWAVLTIILGSSRTSIMFSNFNIFMIFVACTCIDIFVSICWYLTFEAPFIVIDTFLVNSLIKLTKRTKVHSENEPKLTKNVSFSVPSVKDSNSSTNINV